MKAEIELCLYNDLSDVSALLTHEYAVNPIKLAGDLNICLIDVASGSDTRVLVKKVLQWDADFTSYEFEKLKSAFAEVLELLCNDTDRQDEVDEDDGSEKSEEMKETNKVERFSKLKCLAEKVLEY